MLYILTLICCWSEAIIISKTNCNPQNVGISIAEGHPH